MGTVYTYAELTDLDWGTIPPPTNAQHWLDAGAEEIDAAIGFLYSTPVLLSESAEQRPAKLLLKRINSWLAMGRGLLSIDAGNEDDQLHQLGLYYVSEASKALAAIVDGTIVLPGVDPTTPTSDQQTGPMVTNVDESSFVEGFSDVFGNPAANVLNAPRQILLGNRYTW